MPPSLAEGLCKVEIWGNFEIEISENRIMENVHHFTKGFNSIKHEESGLLPTSISYLRKFTDKGHYVFVENHLIGDYVISGKFNAQTLKFLSVGEGNYLYRAEVSIESISIEANSYEVIFSHSVSARLQPR